MKKTLIIILGIALILIVGVISLLILPSITGKFIDSTDKNSNSISLTPSPQPQQEYYQPQEISSPPSYCNTRADTNCDGIVSRDELGSFANAWSNDELWIDGQPVTKEEILEASNVWMNSGEDTNQNNQQAYQMTNYYNQQIELSAQRIQNILQRSEYFKQLPSTSAVLLTFWDGNHNSRLERFFISGGGVVSNYAGQNYDIELRTGDYNILSLENSNDICAELTRLYNSQDVGFTPNTNIFGLSKYMSLASCVPIN